VGLRRVIGPWVGAGADHNVVSVCVNRGLSFAEYEAPEGDQRALQQVERLDTTASGRLLAQTRVHPVPARPRLVIGVFAKAACGRGEPAMLGGCDADVREAIHNLNSIDIRLGRYLAPRPWRKTVGTPSEPRFFAQVSGSEPFSS